jgi:glycerophosphoryl diester phosphodiesterase
VVITGDGQVLVSHEAWLSHEFCLDSLGNEVTAENEQSFNLYHMSYDQIKQFDCGSRIHARFPAQKKMKVYKPLLTEVIIACEAYAKEHDRPLPGYNIEVKWEVDGENVFQPSPEEFSRLVLDALDGFQLGERVNLQTFDIPTLLAIHRQNPEMRLALLVDETENYKTKLSELGFYPPLLSPWFELVDEEMVAFAKGRGMKVVPWTVNEKADMERMIEVGVDGIITDFPDELLKMVKRE